MTKKIIGAPGAGKTHTLIGLMMDSGIPWHRIMFTSLTNASVDEAKARAKARGASDEDLRHFRTMHSLSKSLVGVKKEQLITGDYKEFAEVYGYKFSKDLSGGNSGEGADNFLMQAYNRARSLQITMDTLIAQDHSLRQFEKTLRTFVARYEDWKNEHDRFDFIDLIMQSIKEGGSHPVDLAIFDEFQDFSPLMVEQARIWIEAADNAIIAGDYNQAIYEFSGTRPELFRDFPADETIHLSRSWRVPQKVAEKAISVIRKNPGNLDFNFSPTDVTGHVIEVGSLGQVVEGIKRRRSEGIKETYFVLARTERPSIIDARAFFRRSGIPCGGSDEKLRLVKLFLRRPQYLIAEDLRILTGDLVPQRGMWRHGEKAKLNASLKAGHGGFPKEEWAAAGMEPALVSALLDGRVPAEVKMSPDEITYYESVLNDWGGDLKLVECLTIHKSKGREADIVVALTDITGRIRQNEQIFSLEEERRVWYVALTRARKAVLLLQEHKSGCSRTTIV